MTDILNPNQNSQLDLQAGREIPKVNIAPSTFDPGAGTPTFNDNPPAAPTSTATPQDSAPLLEQASGVLMPMGDPSAPKLNDNPTPDTPQATPEQVAEAQAAIDQPVVEQAPEEPAATVTEPSTVDSVTPPTLLPSSEVFGTTPSFGIEQGTPVDTGVYFQPTQYNEIPFDAAYSGKQTQTDFNLTADERLARNENLTPDEINNRELENRFAAASGQEIQHNGIFQVSRNSSSAYIPQPEQLVYEKSNIELGIRALATNLIGGEVNRIQNERQVQFLSLLDSPFEVYEPAMDLDLLNIPSSADLLNNSGRIPQVAPALAPSSQGVNATDNALVEAFGNLVGEDARRGGTASRRRGQDGTIVSNVLRTVAGGAGNIWNTLAGLGASVGVGIQTIGRTAVNLAEGEGTRALPNAFRESVQSGQGQIAAKTYREWTSSMPTGETAVRGQQTFNPWQGQFGDYGNGTLGGVFYAMDLPANLLLGGVYTVADALDYDVRLGGQQYTGNRFFDAVTGRDTSFTQRADNISYLSPVRREENKPTSRAIGQWGAAFVADVLTGNISDAVVGVVTRTGREAVRTSQRFASNSLPNFISNPARPATVAQPIVTPPGANRARLTTPNTIYENPNMPPAVPPVSASAPTNSLPNALQQLDPRLNLNANYNNLQNGAYKPTPVATAPSGNAYITPNADIWEPSPANSLEAVNSNTQLIAQELANHNRRNAPVVGIPNSTVPNAPVNTVPVTTPQELIRRVETEAAVQRQVAQSNPTLASQIVPVPSRVSVPTTRGELANPQTAARFVQNAIDDGAISVDPGTNTVNLTPEIFAERVARQNDLSNTRESLVELLQTPLTPEVKVRAESQLARVTNELSQYTDLPASQQTIDVTATRVVESETPALDVAASPVRNLTEEAKQEEIIERAKVMLDEEIARLEEQLRGNGVDPDAPINWESVGLGTPEVRQQLERVVALAEESAVPVQKALAASGIPDMPVERLESLIGRQLEIPEPTPRLIPDPKTTRNLQEEVLSPEEALRLAQEDVPRQLADSSDTSLPNADEFLDDADLGAADEYVEEIPAKRPTANDIEWERSPLDKKGAVYDVDINTLDNAWKAKNPQEYVGQAGRGGIGNRYNAIGEHLSSNRKLTMPTVDVDQDGYIQFVDGRHRTAWARDNGATSIPVFVRNPGAVGNRPGWTRRGKVGKPITPAQVDDLIPVVKQSDLSAPISPVDVQKVTREAAAKKSVAPPIDPAEVQVVKRTNQQLSAIARNTIDPDTGKPIWKYKRPMSTKELEAASKKYGDILSRYGKDVDAGALDAPVKRVEVEKPSAASGKARKTQLSESVPTISEPKLELPKTAQPSKKTQLTEQYTKLQKELRDLENSGEMSPKAFRRMDKLEVKLSELKEQIDELDDVEEFIQSAPVSQKGLDFVPTPEPAKKLQEVVAVTETQMVRAGEEAKRLEQQLVDMVEPIQKDKDLYAEIAHAGRQNIENEFLTKEWSGLIDPLDSPNRIKLERPDIGGAVNKNTKPLSAFEEQARNLGIKNVNQSSLDELVTSANDLALQNGLTSWDLKNQGNLKDLIREAVERINNGQTVNTTTAYSPVLVSPDGLAASKSMDEIFDYLVGRGFNYDELGLLDEIDVQAMYETAVSYPRRSAEELTGIKGFEDLEDVPNVLTDDLMKLEPLEPLPVKTTGKIPTSLADLQSRVARFGSDRQKEAIEFLKYVDLPNAKITTMDEWLAVEAESSRIWDIASQYDQADTIELNGIKPFAVERMARFAPGSSATRAVLNAPVGGLTDDMLLRTVGGENPVGRASLYAQEAKHGSYVAPEVRKWSRMLGETVWAKATPQQRVTILKELGADELEGIGVVFKTPIEPSLSPMEQAAKRLGITNPNTQSLGQVGSTVKHLAFEDGLTAKQLELQLDSYIKKAVDRINRGVKVSGDTINIPIVKSSPSQLKRYDWKQVDETLKGLGVPNPSKLPQYKKSTLLQYVGEFGMPYEEAMKRIKWYDNTADVPRLTDEDIFAKVSGIPTGALELTPERVAAQGRAVEVNSMTFYHGTKSEIGDLSVINPKQGSSFAELGSGIYLTNSPADAEHYAKAFIPENKYPTGDVRTAPVGRVHEVKVKVSSPLDGNEPLPKAIGKKFNQYLQEVHPDIAYRTGSKTRTSTVLLKVREAATDVSGRVPVSESRMVEIQRVFTDIVQSEGYDSIVKMNRDGTMTASVFNGANIKTTRQTPIGDGSLAEGYFSRKYLDDFMHSQYPNFQYTRANMLKSRIEAEEFMFKETEKAWKETAIEAEDAAGRLAQAQNELERVNRVATRQTADDIVAQTEDATAKNKELRKYMEDTDNLCL